MIKKIITSIEIKDDENNTPLHAIAKSDELTADQKRDLVDLFVKKGADKNAINDENRTPLAEAVIKGDVDNDVVIKLLNKSPVINNNIDVFTHAMLMDKLDLAKDLLETGRFDPNYNVQVRGESFTPLTKAIEENEPDFFNALLNHENNETQESSKSLNPPQTPKKDAVSVNHDESDHHYSPRR